jgi:hypothetical protein
MLYNKNQGHDKNRDKIGKDRDKVGRIQRHKG